MNMKRNFDQARFLFFIFFNKLNALKAQKKAKQNRLTTRKDTKLRKGGKASAKKLKSKTFH